MLALALSGIGVGSYLYTLRDAARPAEPWTLAVSIGFEAIAVGFPLALGDHVAIYAAYTRHLAGLGFPALVASWATVTALVVLPAAIVSGYQFPLLFALLGRGRTGVARHVGMAYAFNTVGSILGALIGGFVLLPAWGAVASWRFVTWVLGALAVATAVAALFWPRPVESSGKAAFGEYRRGSWCHHGDGSRCVGGPLYTSRRPDRGLASFGHWRGSRALDEYEPQRATALEMASPAECSLGTRRHRIGARARHEQRLLVSRQWQERRKRHRRSRHANDDGAFCPPSFIQRRARSSYWGSERE